MTSDMTTTPQAKPDTEREAFEAWAAPTGVHIYRGSDGEYVTSRAQESWKAWQAGRALAAQAAPSQCPGDRRLLEAISKHGSCVLAELQFERGTNSLAAHNLRLTIIEVDKALAGTRTPDATRIGAPYPLEGITATLAAPQPPKDQP